MNLIIAVKVQISRLPVSILTSHTATTYIDKIAFVGPHSVADPGFARGGGANSRGCANTRFCQHFPKTARNRKNFDAQVKGGARGCEGRSPLRSANGIVIPNFWEKAKRNHRNNSLRATKSKYKLEKNIHNFQNVSNILFIIAVQRFTIHTPHNEELFLDM